MPEDAYWKNDALHIQVTIMEDFEKEQFLVDALFNAIQSADARKVTDLLAQGAPANSLTYPNQQGQTCKQYALSLGDPAIVALFA